MPGSDSELCHGQPHCSSDSCWPAAGSSLSQVLCKGNSVTVPLALEARPLGPAAFNLRNTTISDGRMFGPELMSTQRDITEADGFDATWTGSSILSRVLYRIGTLLQKKDWCKAPVG